MKIKKLEIGPGCYPLGKGWDTLDIVKRPNLTYLVDKNKPFQKIKSNTYDIVYLSHVLEHVAWYNAITYLLRIKRILKKGGIIEVWVPDFNKIVKVYFNKKLPDNWTGPAYLNKKNKKDFRKFDKFDSFLWVLGRLFAYQDGERTENFHRCAFDKDFLLYCLKKAGFVDLKLLKKPRGYDHGFINLGVSGKKPI